MKTLLLLLLCPSIAFAGLVTGGSSSGAGTGDAVTTSPLSQFAATTSAQLRGVLSDETGSGLSMFNTSPRIVTSILDTNGNPLISLTATTSAVNGLTITNSATGNAPQLAATGSDTNLGFKFATKGTGFYTFDQTVTLGDMNARGNGTISIPRMYNYGGLFVFGCGTDNKYQWNNADDTASWMTLTGSGLTTAGTHAITITGTGGTSYVGVMPFTVGVKSVTVLTAATPADIATIVLPAGITRWHISGTSSVGTTGIVVAETASGTLAGAQFSAFDTAGGAGNQLMSSTTGPTTAGTGSGWNAVGLSGATVETATTIYIRQTANSANAGTISFYITVWPLP